MLIKTYSNISLLGRSPHSEFTKFCINAYPSFTERLFVVVGGEGNLTKLLHFMVSFLENY